MSNTQANLGKLWIFDPTKNRWASYESMLRRILAARTIEADGEKKVFLFNHIGPAAYESLEVAMNGQNMDSKSFDELCRVLTGIFEPKGLVASTRHKIFTAKQLADQTSKQFIQQVKSWSIKADFESVVNTRDFVQVQAIIAGLQDKKVKEKLLETPNLDMTKLEEIVELVEGSQSAAKEMAGSNASGTIARLDKKRQKKPLWGKSGKPKGLQGTCYTCGSSQHMQPYCPKRGQRQPPTNQGYQRRQNGRNSGIRAVLPESRYDSEVSSDEDDACLALEQEVEVRRVSIPPVWLKVKLNDIEIAMELDSGAVRSVIPKPVWEKIGRPKISSYTGELHGYGGKPLNVLGTAYIDASFGKHSVLTEMVIVRDRKGQALFGRDLIRDLKVDMGPHVNLNSVAPLEANKETENTLKNEFRELFEPGHGTYKGPAVELKFKKTPEPVFLKSRPVPFALVEKVSKELDRLEAEGSLKRVMNSDFASPLVIIPKANNEIRLCVDFKRTINPQLDVDEYPLPTPESIFQQLNGGKLFSKIDLKAAFNQLRLSEKAQEYCTISTFKGLYRYTRLPFGIASAPARFQATIEQILQGIQGVAVYLDDITVTGPDDQSHIQNLREVLKRLRDSGLRLKPEKCELFQESISLLGHELNAEGIRALPNKVEAITKMPAPKDLKQLASFLGMVQYYSRFVKGLSALAAPLNALRKKTAKWQWGRKEKEAFEKLKERLTSTELLVHYDPKIPVRLSTDASDYGLGAQLEHVYPDGSIKVIGYASRTLTPAEKNYAQIEKEGLGILFGVEKFSQYLYGRKFILQTDHEPLVRIFGPKVGLPTVAARRLQRWAIRLMQYTFEIQYVSTDKFGNADGLSRLPDPAEKPEKFRRMEERHVLAVEAEQSWPISLSKVRKLRSRLNILPRQPQKVSKGEHKAVSKYRQKLAENANKGRREKKFAQGDLVYARKFNDPRIRWIPGVVSELIGQRLLAIQTEFGVLRRHYDQVKRRVVAQESDSDSDEESQDFPQFGNGGGDIGRESHQGQISDTLKTAIERTDSEDNEMSTEKSDPNFEPESFEDGAEIDESPSQDEVMESSRDTSVTPTSVVPNAGVLPRRSSRSRKSPKRLRYDPSFNQIGTVTEEWKASALCSSLDGCTRSMERNPDGQPSQFGPGVPCCQSVFPPSSEASSVEVPSRARLEHLEEM
ncbi:unnamed protein product [Bursaphelenchus xylophilus]|uniref:(pine wood nematode) hypothetical protein n=1 Tax=Bursaphelenchus xylophilus TaxID=6326 RepID=A0A811L6V0_BURXY|nr:unnamed protein product [Bursaphelenchus xylophilus]CAG9111987.1 unnamed protein product [Bursaphelenchus xylophilus]